MKPRRKSVIPGMISQPVSIDSGESIGDEISWGPGQDSYYEVHTSLLTVRCGGLIGGVFVEGVFNVAE